MTNLKVNIAGVSFKNPVITASGCFGFGREYECMYPLEKLGGISLKGMTFQEKLGNPPPRIAETPSGMLNSVGLQNPGVEHFLEHDMPYLAKQDTVKIANIAGSSIEDYCAIAERLSESEIDMFELNISCPNVKQGGAAFGTSCESAERVVKEVRKYAKKPMIVKLSPTSSRLPRRWRRRARTLFRSSTRCWACASTSTPAAQFSKTMLAAFPARPSSRLRCGWCGR